MNNETRARLRAKQDFFQMLAAMAYPELTEEVRLGLRFCDHVGAPTLAELNAYVYPEWETRLDQQLHEMSAKLNVGLPQDWDAVATQLAAAYAASAAAKNAPKRKKAK